MGPLPPLPLEFRKVPFHANNMEWNLRVLMVPCVSSYWNLHTGLAACEARAGECVYVRPRETIVGPLTWGFVVLWL